MLIVNEKSGPHTSDEAFKMALTDALSVAMTRLGVASDIYMGNWTGSKYLTPAPQKAKKEGLWGCRIPEALLKLLIKQEEDKPIEDHQKEWRQCIERVKNEMPILWPNGVIPELNEFIQTVDDALHALEENNLDGAIKTMEWGGVSSYEN